MFEDYCGRCGECCQDPVGIPVDKSDKKRWVKLDRWDILRHIFNTEDGMRIQTLDDDYCVFLKRDGGDTRTCEIYDVKPVICDWFPLTPSKTFYLKPEQCKVPVEYYCSFFD